jgi:vancomycin resistance protein VanJ
VKPARAGSSRFRVFLTALSILYGTVVVGLCLVLYLASDRWWAATLLLYFPRWPWALPLAVLLPAAAGCCRRLLWLLAPVLVLVLVGLMGLCLPWGVLSGAGPGGRTLRVLTCNVHRGELDPAALGRLIADTGPDVVALQDWLPAHEPVVFAGGGWNVRQDGQVGLASRYPLRSLGALDDPDFRDGDFGIARYEVQAPGGSLVVATLHLASPRDGLEEVRDSDAAAVGRLEANSALRRRQSEKAVRWLSTCAAPLVIAGDFNTPPESTIYRQYWSQYTNAFSTAGFGFGATFFTRRAGVRVDHILAGPGWSCRRCWVGPPVGSPHRPLIADLWLQGPPGREPAARTDRRSNARENEPRFCRPPAGGRGDGPRADLQRPPGRAQSRRAGLAHRGHRPGRRGLTVAGHFPRVEMIPAHRTGDRRPVARL